MEVKTSIMKSHDKLSACNTKFIHFVRQNPECLRADKYGLLELNDPLFKLQPWPTFFNRRTKNEVFDASLKVLNLIRDIPARMFAYDKDEICRSYGISRDLADYFLYSVTEEHLGNLLSRGDFVITDSGLKCLEFNINTNLGGMNLSVWEYLYSSVPVISRFMKENNIKTLNQNIYFALLEQLVHAADRHRFNSDEINIAIVMPEDSDIRLRRLQEKTLNSIYYSVLSKVFTGRSGQVFVNTFPELKVFGEGVFYNDKKIHYIIEWCQGYVPSDILKLFKDREILISNGAIAWLLSTKLNLALLSENKDADIFSPEEKEIIEKHIPWTRKVVHGETTYQGTTVQLREFILKNRENLVLKPVLGAGGKDIYIGLHTPKEEWEKIVDFAMAAEDWQDVSLSDDLNERQWYEIAKKAFQVKNWLVQEYMEPTTYFYQQGENGYGEHHAVWGFFIFGSTYGGGWARVLPKKNKSGIINCHQGAKVSVIFEVED
jgi:hypothetical protein